MSWVRIPPEATKFSLEKTSSGAVSYIALLWFVQSSKVHVCSSYSAAEFIIIQSKARQLLHMYNVCVYIYTCMHDNGPLHMVTV